MPSVPVIDPWTLLWKSPFQTHDYEPLYLANTVFGGMLDLSGVTMDLWSSLIGAEPVKGGMGHGTRNPVTALRTRALFRGPALREQGVWLGSAGIHCADPSYTSDASMPHLAQVYDCRQSLDLRTGIATTSGRVVLGSPSAGGDRSIAFTTRIAFLKDSPLLGLEILPRSPDVEVLFAPELVLRDILKLGSEAKGIARIGNAIDCDLEIRQTLLSTETAPGVITYRLRPDGSEPYRVTLRGAAQAATMEFYGKPGFVVTGGGFFTVEISVDDDAPADAFATVDANAFFAEQSSRWSAFWARSAVRLPESEALWQQRYHASLFQVAQSLGSGPAHPGGLSKPMFPYWIGCFHDTDTYFARALLESGHGDQAARHLAYRHRILPVALETARSLGRSGALYPWQTDMNGRGYPHDVPVNGAIIAVEAWHHYLHTGAPAALAAARDILAATLENLADHLDLAGRPLRFKPSPLMTFSETMTAEDPTEARVALRAVARALLDAFSASPTAETNVAALARRILDELPLPAHDDGGLRIGAITDPAYLRCPSVILGSFPLHTLTANGALRATFERELDRIIFLFAWIPHQASIVASQLRIAEGPRSGHALLRAADDFYKGSWHAYDEWENRRSVRAAVFVTAAGGFCLALHAQLLAETEPCVWTLWPGAPAEWRDLEFRDLHTRAGWIVSARREAGCTVFVEARPAHSAASAEFQIQTSDLSDNIAKLSDALASDRGPYRLTVKLNSPLRLGTQAL